MFLFCSLVLCTTALGADFRISSASGFIGFSKAVNSGTSYKGTTVFLDNDIDFSGDGLSEQFEPIGKNSKYFQGTFDGQGYTISGLIINSSSKYVGLFEHARGVSIKNVVLGSSCGVNSSGGDTHICRRNSWKLLSKRA